MKARESTVSKKKLIHEITKRNMTMKDVSLGCGFAEDYLYKKSAVASRNNTDELRIAVAMVMLLREKYNIRTESIMCDIPKEEPTTVRPTNEYLLKKEQLYEIIYSAVFEAMKRALKGD